MQLVLVQHTAMMYHLPPAHQQHLPLTCAQVVSRPPGPATRSKGPLSLYLTMM